MLRYKKITNNEIEDIALFDDTTEGANLALSLGFVLASDDDEIATTAPIQTDDEIYQQIRDERDRLLSECDWTQASDSPLTDAQKAEWQTYRQSLRDIMTVSNILETVTWPTKP